MEKNNESEWSLATESYKQSMYEWTIHKTCVHTFEPKHLLNYFNENVIRINNKCEHCIIYDQCASAEKLAHNLISNTPC